MTQWMDITDGICTNVCYVVSLFLFFSPVLYKLRIPPYVGGRKLGRQQTRIVIFDIIEEEKNRTCGR